ncbi:MAG TPA: enoyl-CoA hydratase-related protein [Burkholderiales bacterium]|jgi:enoyl-CoA hydratase/carnithine racemase|nr:enoyl-CoA hydratase-related protein [Burkholderiales bacterium]
MHSVPRTDLIQYRVEDRGEAGRVAYITVNNPEKRNTLGMPGKRAIADTFNKLAADDLLRVAVITGAGDKSFIAGADIAEMKDLNAEQAEVEHTLTHVANESIQMFPVPVIARINGWCLGFGTELAAACDMRIGVDTAKFGMPEVRVGIPSGMEAVLLPALVGWGKAAELIYTGDIIDAEEAYRCGFLQKVVPAAELDVAVEKMVSSILLGGPRAIRLQKALIRDWQRMSITDSVWQGIRACVAARSTDEPKRMMEAFMARKRK